MQIRVPDLRPWFSLLAGVTVGLSGVWASTTTFAALLPKLAVTSVADGQILSGTVTLAASADAAGLAAVRFQVSGADVGSEITSGSCSVAWDTRTSGDGVRTVVAIGRDSQGVTVTSAPVLVTVLNTSSDAQAPSVAITAPANGSTVSNSIALTASAADNTGVAGVWFAVDGANLGSEDQTAPYGVTWNTLAVGNGSHIVTATARDAAGNMTTSSGVIVTVNNVTSDRTAPAVAITAPANGAIVGGTVALAVSASDNVGVAGVQWYVDGGAIGAEVTSSPFASAWNTALAGNGSHAIRAVARDGAGNSTTSAAVTVTVSNVQDSTAPSVGLTSPADGAMVAGTITVSASASDNVGVAGVRFQVDGTTIGAEDTTSPFSVTWNSAGVASGPHTLRAIARDAAGNTRTSSSRSVLVNNVQDTVAPSISVTSPSGGAVVRGTVTVSASASDNTGILGVQFLLDGEALGGEATRAPFQVSWPSNLVLNGSHTLTARARDMAGNTRTSSGVRVTVRNIGSGVQGDLDNDGRPDLMFEHDSGQMYAWFMKGNVLAGQTSFVPGAVQPIWRVVAMDDFNGDKRQDLLWQHAVTGQLYIWLMDGVTLIGDLRPPSAAPDWRVAGTGDFNQDGKPDIVWMNRLTQQVYVWFMDGDAMIGGDFIDLPGMPTNWRIAAVGDFNHDGRPDLLWQDTVAGSLAVTFVSGTRITAVTPLNPAAVSPAWAVRAAADYDGDGSIDIVWQNQTTGQLYLWYLNGTTMVRDGVVSPGQVGTAWQIVGGR